MRSSAPDQIQQGYSMPAWVGPMCGLALIAGCSGVAVGFVISPRATWIWLLFCFVTFGGIANGLLAWAAAFRIAQARWTPALTRLAHSAIAFVPFLAAVLVALLAGAKGWMPWITHPIHGRSTWFNWAAFAARDFLALATLWLLFFAMVRLSLGIDARARRGEEITSSDHRRLNMIVAVAAMVFSIAETIIAWDLVMALSPEWVSTMFGPYYFVGNLYAGMAALIVIAALVRKPTEAEQFLEPRQFYDMGNLMLGFSLLMMGLFYAQYVTIWYENLPHEVRFLLVRYMYGPWSYIGWASFVIAYGAPFVLLQSRYIKRRSNLLWPVAALGLAGFALERYVLIVPSLYPNQPIPYPVAVTSILGFASAFVLSIRAFMRRYVAVSKADEALAEIYMEIEKAETY